MIVSGSPLRFLVVDDDDDVRSAFALIVERLGHVADQAGDGVEAIELLAAERYDYLLLDLTMPRMSGEDVMRWLRDHPEWGKGLRVVVVTALATLRRPELVALGAHTILAKPVRVSELRDLVRGTCDPARSVVA